MKKALFASLLFAAQAAGATGYNFIFDDPTVSASFDLNDQNPPAEDFGTWANFSGAVSNLVVKFNNLDLTRDAWDYATHQNYQGVENAPVEAGDEVHAEFNLYLEGANNGTGIDNAQNLDQKPFSIRTWTLGVWQRVSDGVYEYFGYGGEVASVSKKSTQVVSSDLYPRFGNDEGCR